MRRKFWVIVLKKDCQLIQNTITCYQFTIFVARVYVDMYQRHPWQCQVILGVFWGFKSRFQFRMIKNSALFLAPPTFFPNKNMARKIPGTATTFAHACVMTPCYRHVMRATPRSPFPVVTGMMDRVHKMGRNTDLEFDLQVCIYFPAETWVSLCFIQLSISSHCDRISCLQIEFKIS